MPHAEATFYKMRCGWAGDRKVAALARFGAVDACLGRDLFGQLIDYSRRELTDGIVPVEAIGLVAYPLPADDALRIAEQLADPGPFGPLCAWDAPGNAGSNARRNALRILAYAKWNDTRAEVEQRREQGTKAARTRWDRADQAGDAPPNAGSNAQAIQSKSKSKNPPSPPGREQWSPSRTLDTPPAPQRGGVSRSGPRTTHPNAAAAIADATRPGGPATAEQIAAHAAEARRALGIPAPPEPDPLPLDLDPAPAEPEYPF